ncbi:MAG: carbohydrate kinase [Cytophagaceae bacterium]|nr:carbohydrate kinase [Cytophagaceae bacterium]
MIYIGYDIGSSSVKAAVVDAKTGKALAVATSPSNEMSITATQPSFAEQNPEIWWQHLIRATHEVLQNPNVSGEEVKGIGIAYQMHGLVCLDAGHNVLRDAIIWCDSRAIDLGNEAYVGIGAQYCKEHLLNSPGNFTASKLAWVKKQQPELYRNIDKVLLPGDYIAFKLTGRVHTTVAGLTEAILWDFTAHQTSKKLLDQFGFDKDLIPDIVPTFGDQGEVSAQAAHILGLPQGTPILYRAGDQPNNALALNVFEPGEIAATAGTSGVIYAITDSLKAPELEKVNSFAHVNHRKDSARIGKLLNINGAGSAYRWLKNTAQIKSYQEMNALSDLVAIGSDGICIYPYGNGSERMFENKTIGYHMQNAHFNRHDIAHLCRATLEGIAFSFVYGLGLMKQHHINPQTIRAGNDNLFQSHVMGTTIATLTGCEIEIYNTTGAIGAARACTIALLGYDSFKDFVSQNDHITTYTPDPDIPPYQQAYDIWLKGLHQLLKTQKQTR